MNVGRWLRQLRPTSPAFWLVCLAPALFIATVIAVKEWPRILVVVTFGLVGFSGTALVLLSSSERPRRRS